MTYFINILIAIDQVLHTLVGGAPDETLSAMIHRKSVAHGGIWCYLETMVDLLFFWQIDPHHCERAYLSEINRKHLPHEYGDNGNRQ